MLKTSFPKNQLFSRIYHCPCCMAMGGTLLAFFLFYRAGNYISDLLRGPVSQSYFHYLRSSNKACFVLFWGRTSCLLPCGRTGRYYKWNTSINECLKLPYAESGLAWYLMQNYFLIEWKCTERAFIMRASPFMDLGKGFLSTTVPAT